MSEGMKNDLDRAARHYPPPQDALERLKRKRERDQHNEKLTALVIGLGVAAVGIGLALFAFRPSHSTQPGAGPSVDAAAPTNGDLLYAKYDGSAGWHLFAADPATGSERLLTHGTRDYGSDWSPDGTKIVYDSESSSGYDIVVANADGSDPNVIAAGKDPTWSPDGTRIAYAGEGGSIWVVNIDGSDAYAVTEGATAGQGTEQNAAFDWNPAWSPDGNSIAYTRVVAHRYAPLPNGQGSTDVTLQQVMVWHDGANPTETMLTDAYTNVGEVDWSPDGSTIVFTGAPTLFNETETNGLAWPRVLLVPADGGSVTPISPDEKTWAAGATWSPDGEWIAYVDNNHSLVVMRPDGTDRRTLAIDPGGDEIIGPSWGVAPSA
jgi:Tol biopolymer transport system component